MFLFRREKKQPQKKFTRIFFTTDIHGSEPCFLKFLQAASFYKADAIVLGGDITGKQIIAIENRGKDYCAHLFAQEWTARTPEELERLQSQIRSNGFYPVVVTPPELAELEADPQKVEALFRQVMTETVARWIKLAEERLRGSPVRCYISPGNDDQFDLDAVLASSDVVIYPEGKVVDLDGVHSMASCGYANMTPWRCPRDVEEDELYRRLEAIMQQAPDPSKCIVNFHAPPYDSTLDSAPVLDANFKPVKVGGQEQIVPVGSKAVRAIIEKYRPLVGLHGHIHECRGAVNIGRTVCLNPGSEYSEGILHGVLVNVGDGKLLSHQLVSG